jgi:hypothetical protein
MSNEESNCVERMELPRMIVPAQLLVDYLNHLLALDPAGISALMDEKVSTTKAMENHPQVVVGGEEGRPMLSMLGLLQGLVGSRERVAKVVTGMGTIIERFAVVVDEAGDGNYKEKPTVQAVQAAYGMKKCLTCGKEVPAGPDGRVEFKCDACDPFKSA